MMSTGWRVPLSASVFGEEEEEALMDVLRHSSPGTCPQAQALEAECATLLGVAHAVAVSSGTAALHLALTALGVGPHDEVIQPAINAVAAANMTVAVGAEPVFADVVSADYPLVGPEQVERAWTSRTVAVVVNHYAGYPCDVESLREYCDDQGLVLIEDASHALGVRWRGRPLGTWGDVGCFSLSVDTNPAAGGGGLLVTDRDDVAERVRALRCQGATAPAGGGEGDVCGFDVAVAGFNYRMDELRAAVARVQLRKLDEMIRRRREHSRRYCRLLEGMSGVFLAGPRRGTGGAGWHPIDESGCRLMSIVMAADARDELIRACRARGVQTGWHYPCLAELSAFRGMTGPRQVTVSREFSRRQVTLPMYPSLRPEDIDWVCDVVRECTGAGVR